MRFLVDRCAGRRLAEALSARGHEVLEARSLGEDPGDDALLALAAGEQRVLVTIDTDFGHLVFTQAVQHCGVVRLPDVPAAERVRLMALVLDRYEPDLASGAIVTVRRGRVRVSRPPFSRPAAPEGPKP
jgi:predicted nuclease of predicted toxin-antitoxin system